MSSNLASFHLATFPRRRLLSRLLTVPAERWELTQAPGCVLGKVLGTSRAGTTRISADLSRWAIFAVWQNDESHARFLRDSTLLRRWRASAVSLKHYSLQPVQSRGKWNGVDPFDTDAERTSDGSVAALTRASVRWRRWMRFARSVGPVDDALTQQVGCKWALGIGEWPIGEQATFSVWDHNDAVDTFAYEDIAHRNVVQRTFDENWYDEMLFARFTLLEEVTEI